MFNGKVGSRLQLKIKQSTKKASSAIEKLQALPRPPERAHTEFRVRSRTLQSCPICAAAAEFWCQAPDHHYGNTGRWDVYKCSHCGHLFQYPIPKEEDLVQFYPASYYAHQPPITDFTPRGLRHRGVWLREHYLKYFRGYQQLAVRRSLLLGCLGYILCHRPLHFDSPEFKPGGIFLDYGCGTGNAVAFAQYIGWTAEGIEINASAAQAGRDAGIRVDEGSIEMLESRRERYDYIMSSHCVEHVPDVWRLFRAFFAALKPGGVLAIDVPNGGSLAAERFKELYYYLCMPVHVHLFTPASIRLLAQSIGFVEISTTAHNRWYTQTQSAVWRRRSGRQGLDCVRFPFRSRWECLLGRINSLPTYIWSQAQSRGDCLTMTCRRPLP